MVTVAVMTECTVTDYGCETYFKVINQTGGDIVVNIGYPEGVVHKSTYIESGDEQTVYFTSGRCAKEGVIQNPFSPEELIFWTYIEYVEINGEIMPDEFRKSKYWDFVSSGRRHDIIAFTLTLTNELLEEFRQQENCNAIH